MKRRSPLIVFITLLLSACISDDGKTSMEKAKSKFDMNHEKVSVNITDYKSWGHGSIVLNIYNDTDGIQAEIPITKDFQQTMEFNVSNEETSAKVTYYRGKNIVKLLDPSGSAKPPSGTGNFVYQQEDAVSGYIKVEPIGDNNKQNMIKIEFHYLVFPNYTIKKIGPINAYVGVISPT